MRQLSIIMLTALICAASRAADKPNSTLRFDETEWNFGTIRELDGPVTHKFTFTNTGGIAVVIESVEVSCGCTSPKYSTAPVKPGERGAITITYDPAGRPGAFSREVEVRSSNGANYNLLIVKGNVTPRPRTVEDDYPVDMGSGVRLARLWLDFGNVGQGRAKSMTVGYVNTSKRAVAMRAAPLQARRQLRIGAPQQLAAGERGEITVSYDLSGGPCWGRMSDEIYVCVNGSRTENPIITAAVGVDDFAGVSGAAPKAQMLSMFHHFGDTAAGKRLTKEFSIANEGQQPLIVRDVQCGGMASTSLKAGEQIKQGSKLKFNIILSASDTKNGRVSGSVTIILNDPLRPMREVRVVANVLP
jgi:hypothetical protein